MMNRPVPAPWRMEAYHAPAIDHRGNFSGKREPSAERVTLFAADGTPICKLTTAGPPHPDLARTGAAIVAALSLVADLAASDDASALDGVLGRARKIMEALD